MRRGALSHGQNDGPEHDVEVPLYGFKTPCLNETLLVKVHMDFSDAQTNENR